MFTDKPYSYVPNRTTIASVTDLDDAVLAMIYRHAEHVPADSGPSMTVISVVGEVDGDTAPHLERALQQAFRTRGPVCCDLSGTSFFGAAGAWLVIHLAHQAAVTGRVFLLRGVNRSTARLLEGLGFDCTLIID